MLGIHFIKAGPTTHVLQFRNGKLIRSGRGLAFPYYAPTANIMFVPVESIDLPFAFNEGTADFQQITIHGQLSFRVENPELLAQLFNFSVDRSGRHTTDDLENLQERLLHVAQVVTRGVCHRLSLREALAMTDEFFAKVARHFTQADSIRRLGIEVLDFTITSIVPTPEMARALEAQSREALSREADEAMYNRRNAAVNQERIIRENELETELAVEGKRRAIEETKWAIAIESEKKRALLVEQQAANDKQVADTKAYALKAFLEPLQGADWKTLTAVQGGAMSPELIFATAIREIADNAGKIGEINFSPDLLSALTRSNKK